MIYVSPALRAECRSQKTWPSWVVEGLLDDLATLHHRVNRSFSLLAEAGSGELAEAVLEATDVLAGAGETYRKGDHNDY